MIDRIVVINDISAPKGGATALALASAYAFRERGHAVTYLTGDGGDNGALADAGVDIVALGRNRLLAEGKLTAMVDGLYNRAAAQMLSAWIAANDTLGTVYHVHGWSQIFSPALFKAMEAVKDRLVYSAHDFFLACPNGAFSFLKTGKICTLTPMSTGCIGAQCDRRGYPHKLWRVARQAVQRHHYDRRRSPPVLAIHERMRPFLMRAGIPDAAIETLPNPVRPWLETRVAAEENREFLFVGRLEYTKGPDLAAAAARAAGVTLRLVGDGELRADLQARYPEFHFMGHQPADAIRNVARNARALLMPSRYPEPYGLVAAEALWSGLPVIAADTAFLSHDIVAAGAGLAVEPRDTQAFADAIRRLAQDDTLTKGMSQAAFEDSTNIGLTPDQWIDRLLERYSRCLSHDQKLET